MSLQELADQIAIKFSLIHAGRGILKIKHLESDFGDILDLTDSVGDVFDDRTPNGENRTSIVKVARDPPEPSQQGSFSRFGSLMPESTARPRKRPLQPSFLSQNIIVEALPTTERIEDKDGENRIDGHRSKRQRQERRTSRISPPSRLSFEDGRLERWSRDLSSDVAIPGPSSRGQPQMASKERNPAVYDTPQSFLFGRSHHNKRETEIPDSPTRRKASFTRIPDEPKSESPEPRASIYETPPEDENRRPKSRARIIASEHKFPETEPPSDSLDASASAEHSRNEFHFSSPAARAHHALGTRQDTIIPILNRSSLEVQRHSNAASGSRKPMAQEVFDPIETDSDNFDGKQRMYQPKPLRLSRTPNSRGATSGPLQLQDAAVDQPNESNSSPNYTAFNPEEIHELSIAEQSEIDRGSALDLALKPTANTGSEGSWVKAGEDFVFQREKSWDNVEPTPLEKSQEGLDQQHCVDTAVQNASGLSNQEVRCSLAPESQLDDYPEPNNKAEDLRNEQLGGQSGANESAHVPRRSPMNAAVIEAQSSQNSGQILVKSSQNRTALSENMDSEYLDVVSPNHPAHIQGQLEAEAFLKSRRSSRSRLEREELERRGEQMMTATNGAKHLDSIAVEPSTLEKRKKFTRSAEQKRVRNERERRNRAELKRRRDDDSNSNSIQESIRSYISALVEDTGNAVTPSEAAPSSQPSSFLMSSPLAARREPGPRSAIRGSRPPIESRPSVSFSNPPEDAEASATLDENLRLGTLSSHPDNSGVTGTIRESAATAATSQFVIQQQNPRARQPLPRTKAHVQTKLPMTVDRKMKGREIENNSPPRPSPLREVLLSSDSEDNGSVSSWYSEDERLGLSKPKAGPSTRKKAGNINVKPSLPTHRPPAPDSSVIDPLLSLRDADNASNESAVRTLARIESLPRYQSRSTASRSPARGLADTVSVQSEASSDSSPVSTGSQKANVSKLDENKSASVDARTASPRMHANSTTFTKGGSSAQTQDQPPKHTAPKIPSPLSSATKKGSKPPTSSTKHHIVASSSGTSKPVGSNQNGRNPTRGPGHKYARLSDLKKHAAGVVPLEEPSVKISPQDATNQEAFESEDETPSSSDDDTPAGIVHTLRNFVKKGPALTTQPLPVFKRRR